MTKILISSVFAVFALSACGSGAKLVRGDQAGGLIVLQGAYVPAMSEARLLMVEHCGGRFQTDELGDQVAFLCRNPQLRFSSGALAVAAPAQQARPASGL